MNAETILSAAPPRRSFIKTSALAAAAFALPRFSIGRAGGSPNGKINVASIGIGNRGWFAVSELMKDPRVNFVAVCDVDRVLVNDKAQNNYVQVAARNGWKV